MEFEYTDSIWVEPEDLEEIFEKVKKGVPFRIALRKVIGDYGDDYYFYRVENIKDLIEAEINRRLREYEESLNN